jgi:hypothetical protein
LTEVKKLALKDVKLKIYAPPERKVIHSSTRIVVIADDRVVLHLDRRKYSGWIEHIQKS